MGSCSRHVPFHILCNCREALCMPSLISFRVTDRLDVISRRRHAETNTLLSSSSKANRQMVLTSLVDTVRHHVPNIHWSVLPRRLMNSRRHSKHLRDHYFHVRFQQSGVGDAYGPFAQSEATGAFEHPEQSQEGAGNRGNVQRRVRRRGFHSGPTNRRAHE